MKSEKIQKTSMQALNTALDRHLVNLTDAELDEFLRAARKAKDAVKAANERKRQNQKKYILGGLVGWMIETGKMSQMSLDDFLGEYLTKNADRELFGLSPLPDPDQPVIKNGIIEPSYMVADVAAEAEAEEAEEEIL